MIKLQMIFPRYILDQINIPIQNQMSKRKVLVMNRDYLQAEPLPQGWVNAISLEELKKYYGPTKSQELLEFIQHGGIINVSWIESCTSTLNLMAAIRKNDPVCLSWP